MYSAICLVVPHVQTEFNVRSKVRELYNVTNLTLFSGFVQKIQK